MGTSSIEPTSDQRQMALTIRQIFMALVESGFSESQALIVVGYIFATSNQ